MTIMNDEVQWRVAAMRARCGDLLSIPFLVARDDVLASADTCESCGNPLPQPIESTGVGRCDACIQAAKVVTDERWQAIQKSNS